MDFSKFLRFLDFLDFYFTFYYFFGILSKLLRVLRNITEVTTEHQKWPKISTNSVKSRHTDIQVYSLTYMPKAVVCIRAQYLTQMPISIKDARNNKSVLSLSEHSLIPLGSIYINQ